MTTCSHRPAAETEQAHDAEQGVELLRALGSVALTPPPGADQVTEALGLPAISRAQHTDAFVLHAVPHAAIYLGEEGKLGGEGLDRIEGFWRAVGSEPPKDADHLGVLLLDYAQLLAYGQESEPAYRAAGVLLAEHLSSWAPAYLQALGALGIPPVTGWAQLVLQALAEQEQRWPARAALPLALREAPAAITSDAGLEELLDALVAPVRCGMILTHPVLNQAAAQLGMGYRRGERRFALRAMMDQDKTATLRWLAGWARHSASEHAESFGDPAVGAWWVQRAQATAQVLDVTAQEAQG